MAGSATAKGTHGRARSGLLPIEFQALALRCPVCNTEFTAELPNVGEPEGRDTDLRPRYPTVDPMPTLIHACPSCRYTAYRDGFESRGERDEEDENRPSPRAGDRPPHDPCVPDDDDIEDLRRWIRRGSLVAGVSENREPFGAERYVLGARVYEFLSDDEAYGAADYYLRGAWCARGVGNRELERRCQMEAVERFEHALEHSLVPDADKPRTLYLLGELSRRLGDFAKAVDLFSQLDTSSEFEDEETALFAYLARRQLALAAAKSDINASIDEDPAGLIHSDDE